MSDWTTARVVRDRDGDMWGREREGWNLISAENTEAWYPSDDLLAEQFGPLGEPLNALAVWVRDRAHAAAAGVKAD